MRQIKTSLDENEQQLEFLKTANPDMKDQEIFAESLAELELRVKNESKLLAKDNNPTLTYSYLLDITENYCPAVKFDFKYIDNGQVETSFYNEYSVIGVSPIAALYTFIYQLENQFMLYVVESLKLYGIEEDSEHPKNYIYFSLVLRAYYEDNMLEVDDIPFRYLKYRTLSNNPFVPGIHGPIPNDYEMKFVELDQCDLIGLTLDKAFLLDRNGKIHVLKPGDKIAFGYLDHINWDEQNAVFYVNVIGINTKKTMSLKYYED
ncbi:hypothetical protein ACFLYJ_00600 [Candidatus Cloacimonadota bacterium]